MGDGQLNSQKGALRSQRHSSCRKQLGPLELWRKRKHKVCRNGTWNFEVRLHFPSRYSKGPDEAGLGSWVTAGNVSWQQFPGWRTICRWYWQEVGRSRSFFACRLPGSLYRPLLAKPNSKGQRRNVCRTDRWRRNAKKWIILAGSPVWT